MGHGFDPSEFTITPNFPSDDEGEYVREDFGREGIYGAEEVALGFQGIYRLADLSDVVLDFFACVYKCMGSETWSEHTWIRWIVRTRW